MIAFDDGPLETTGAILDVLAEYRARAVFFVVGERIAGHEALLRRMVAEGHEIGNHGWSHVPHDEMTLDQVRDSIVRTSAAVFAAAGVRPSRFRPPFVRRSEVVVSACRLLGMGLELRSSLGDYELDAVGIVEAALALPKDATVWLHDGHWPTVEALPEIIVQRGARWAGRDETGRFNRAAA